MARVVSVSAETIQIEGFAVSGEFTGASVETLPTNSGENTFTTSTAEITDQVTSGETTFQTLALSMGESPSAEGTFTTLPVSESPTTPEPPGGGGGGNNGGGGGGGGGRRVTSTVPLAPISLSGYCPVYLTKFIHLGRANDPAEVLKLQRFLRDAEGFANVPLSGFYDLTTYQAVMAFQTRYAKDILAPWGINHPTGYVYITTTLAINNLHCERDPQTTLDLRYYRFTPSGIEAVPTNEVPTLNRDSDQGVGTTTLPFPTDESEMGQATSTSRLFLAALGVFNFFKQIPGWWWILILLLIIAYLTFELIRERRRHRPSPKVLKTEKREKIDPVIRG